MSGVISMIKYFKYILFIKFLVLTKLIYTFADELKEYKISPKNKKELSYEITTVFPESKHRFWLEAEGFHNYKTGVGEIERLDTFYGYHFHKYWDLRLGVGVKGGYGNGKKVRDMLVIGIKGLHVYVFEAEMNLRRTSKGEFMSDIELEYNFNLAKKFVIQPRITSLISNKRIEEIDVGKGVNYIGFVGMFFYRINEKVAPYIMFYRKYLVGDKKNMEQLKNKKTVIDNISIGLRFRF